jgi:hypothetical protein
MGHEDVITTLGIYTDVPADFVQRVEDALLEKTSHHADERGVRHRCVTRSTQFTARACT